MFGFGNNQQREDMLAEQRGYSFAREQNAVASADKQFQDSAPMVAPEGHDDLLRWQQELGDELEQLKMDLRNRVRSDQGNWVARQRFVRYDKDAEGKTIEVWENMPPLMNECGVQMVETAVRPLLSRNLINSNLDEDTVLFLLKETSNTLVFNMANRFDEFGLGNAPSPALMSHILRLIKNVIKPTPFRALNDGERRHQRTMNKRIETYAEGGVGMQIPRKKILGLI